MRRRKGLFNFSKWNERVAVIPRTRRQSVLQFDFCNVPPKVRTAAVKRLYGCNILSVAWLISSQALHILIKAVALTSVFPLPDPSAGCLASVSGSSMPRHYHESLAVMPGLVGTLVSVKSNPGNKATFNEACQAPVLIGPNIPPSAVDWLKRVDMVSGAERWSLKPAFFPMDSRGRLHWSQ